MIAKDTAKWFTTFLDFCISAKFLLMCGTVTNKYYIYEFLAKHLPPGYEIEGDLKRKTGFKTFARKLSHKILVTI